MRYDSRVSFRILVFCVLLWASLQAAGQELVDSAPDVQALIDALRPLPATRGVGAPPKVAAAALAVAFDAGSVRLSEQGRRSLDTLGNALTSKTLEAFEFIIEVHVEALGEPSHDKLLSKRRANAIKDYLVKQHQVSPGRLNTEGRGTSKPSLTGTSTAAANVVVINAGEMP